MSSPLEDLIVLSSINYNYPQYVLPWNNTFGRVRPNPFYLANELRNLQLEVKK
jgi:hypothetical protein